MALSLSGLPPDGPVAVVTLIDRLLLDRVDALLRFRDALTHRRTTPADLVTPQRSRHLAEMLRAIDGRLAGATYQDIGEALYGAERVSAISWKSTPVRDTVMRRVRTGFDLVRGGYRSLLYRHRPR